MSCGSTLRVKSDIFTFLGNFDLEGEKARARVSNIRVSRVKAKQHSNLHRKVTQNHGLNTRNNERNKRMKKRSTTTFTEEPIWHRREVGELPICGRRQSETGGRD